MNAPPTPQSEQPIYRDCVRNAGSQTRCCTTLYVARCFIVLSCAVCNKDLSQRNPLEIKWFIEVWSLCLLVWCFRLRKIQSQDSVFVYFAGGAKSKGSICFKLTTSKGKSVYSCSRMATFYHRLVQFVQNHVFGLFCAKRYILLTVAHQSFVACSEARQWVIHSRLCLQMYNTYICENNVWNYKFSMTHKLKANQPPVFCCQQWPVTPVDTLSCY